MTTSFDLIDSALRNIDMPVDIARNDQEMLRMLNQAVDELELGPRTGCAACGGSGCDRCIPDEFDNDTTGEK